MNQLEDQIVATLNDKAVGDVHVADLLAASRERGQRYARRRRAWQACGGVSAAAVAVLGTVAVVPHVHGPGRPDSAAHPAAATPVPRSASLTPTPSPTGVSALTAFRPPAASNAPSAASDPKVIGSNPGLLHFDIASSVLPTPVTSTQWATVDGLERLIVQGGTPHTASVAMLQVQVSRDRSLVDPLTGSIHSVKVGSRTGSVMTTSMEGHLNSQLRWQPFGGVWAEVEVLGDATYAVKVAEAVTFDHVMRCAVPFRLSWVPAGTTLESCNVLFDTTGPSAMASVQVGNSAVTVTFEPGGTVPSAPPTTIAGKPAVDLEYPGDGGHNIFQVDIDYGGHVADLVAEGHYDKATVLRIAAGYQDVSGTDPNDWPASPLG